MLSQYQKVLARVNDIKLANKLDEFINNNHDSELNTDSMLKNLNEQLPLTNGLKWNVEVFNRVQDKIYALNNIISLNSLNLEILDNNLKRPLEEYDISMLMIDLSNKIKNLDLKEA